MTIERISRKVRQQRFSLYLRGLHPELFDIYDEREIFRDCYSATFWVIGSSHVVSFTAGERTITEVLADASHELPVQHRLASVRFAHNLQKSFHYDDGIAYDVHFDRRTWTRQKFLDQVREIRHAVIPDGVLRVFDAGDPGGLPLLTAVGFMPKHRSLSVRTFHTFPDELAIVSTHSRFEVRPAE